MLHLAAALALGACDEPADTLTAADLTEAAIAAQVRSAIADRLSTGAGFDAATLEVSVLIHEERLVANHTGASDLVFAWAHGGSSREVWALAQLYRHRDSGRLPFLFFDAADAAWLPLYAFDAAPTNADATAFLAYWDFVVDGQNGTLVGAVVDAEAWQQRLGDAPPFAYPAGTPLPDEEMP